MDVKMEDKPKLLLFYRIEHPKIKEAVDNLGEIISENDVEALWLKTVGLNLDYPFEYPFCFPCEGGSQKAIELATDDRYAVKEYKMKNPKNCGSKQI